jgi:hypothetical protein
MAELLRAMCGRPGVVVGCHVGAMRDHRGMPNLHFNEERPDQLPISAEVWDQAQKYASGDSGIAAILYRAIRQLETEVIALRSGR